MAILKQVTYQYTVVPNENIEVYSDEELTNQVPGHYFYNIKRGESAEATMWVKNVGEAVDLDIICSTPDAVVAPSSFSLETDQVVPITLTISVPWDAAAAEVNGSIDFVSPS